MRFATSGRNLEPNAKLIFASGSGDACVDALCNRLHAAWANSDDPDDAQRRADAEAFVRDELDTLLATALTHFRGEQDKDGFCPEGVRVVGKID
jgi:hypothetical protein